MKTSSEKVLAQRYAQAYVQVYGNELNSAVMVQLEAFHQFLLAQRRLIFFLTIPTIEDEIKERGVLFLCNKFDLLDSFKKNILLLLAAKRISLLIFFVGFVIDYYRKQRNITYVTVQSSHSLSAEDIDFLITFFANKIHEKKADSKMVDSKIIYRHEIDKNLIAGIRLSSDTHRWEYSIAKQLRSVQLLTVC